MCVCVVSVGERVWLTRVHSQYFEKIPCNSPATTGTRSCGVMTTVSMGIVTMRLKARWWWKDVTSNCVMRSCVHFDRMPRLVMGLVRTCVHAGLIVLCGSKTCNETLCLVFSNQMIQNNTRWTRIDGWLLVIFTWLAVAGCFVFAIMITLPGFTWEIQHQGIVLRIAVAHTCTIGVARICTYCGRPYYLLKVH